MRDLRLVPVFLLAACGTLSFYDPDAPAKHATGETGQPIVGDDDDDDDDTIGTTPEDCLAPGDEDGDGAENCDDTECADTCDADHDGEIAEALGGGDCDDTDPGVNTAAFDGCDGFDDDCNGIDDDGDADSDGSTVCDDCDDTDGSLHPGAADVCGDSVDSDCDGQDCAVFVEGFESGALSGAFTVSGDAGWFVTDADSHTGTYMVRAGNIGDSQISKLELELTFDQPGEVRFWHRGSMEDGYDYFRFYVDNTQNGVWTGVWSWTEEVYQLPAGTHLLSWRFRKDHSNSVGNDTVKLDDLSATNAHP
ncbi:MAG: hypothetical protein KC621_22850 [Myxococcales bacterium]|nr:hypothetical protein [Myxococcales bacterium]